MAIVNIGAGLSLLEIRNFNNLSSASSSVLKSGSFRNPFFPQRRKIPNCHLLLLYFEKVTILYCYWITANQRHASVEIGKKASYIKGEANRR